MNTLHLKYVVEIDRAGSITKAAENLFMGQPNLSKAVRELEESLGIVIFKRTSKGVTPTDKGEQLIRYARSILAQVNELEALCSNEKNESFSLSISCGSSHFISQTITDFISKLPKSAIVDLSFRQTSTMKAIDHMSEGRCDLALIQYPDRYEGFYLDYISHKDIVFEPVWSYRDQVTLPIRSPLAAQTYINTDDLAGFLEISRIEEQIPFSHLQKEDKQQDKLMNRRYVSMNDLHGQIQLLKSHADAYMRMSPMSDEWLLKHELIQRPLQRSQNRRQMVLVYNKGYQFRALEEQFYETLIRHKEKCNIK